MKKTTISILIALIAIVYAGSTCAEVNSLRGDQDLYDMSKEPSKKKLDVVEGGIARSYKLQPPMVPHVVDKYKIGLRNNGCMKCHSETTYEKENAPKVGDSHYVDSKGATLETVSSRRYFCNQCHAPQVKADPLVQNEFEGAK